MDLECGVSQGLAGKTTRTEGSRAAVLTCLEGKHQKSKGGSWSGLRKGIVHLVTHSLPGLPLAACSKSPPNFHQIFQGSKNEIHFSYSQITAAASTCVVCFLPAAMPLQSIGLALYNTWSHLCIQFSILQLSSAFLL